MDKKKITVGIIGGRGRLGRIFKEFFVKNGCNVLISGRTTKLTYKELVRKSDVVVFSVPIHATPSIIKEVLPYTRKEQLLMDLTSIKNKTMKAMLKSKSSVISIHPMFASAKSLLGYTIIVIPARTNSLWLRWLLGLFKKSNINVEIMSAKRHDEIMAILQGLMHFNYISTAHALQVLSKKAKISNMEKLISYGGVMYRIRLGAIARVISQNPELYADILMLNPEFKKALKSYKTSVEKLERIIEKRDNKEFAKYFREAEKFFGKFKDTASKETDLIANFLIKLNKGK